MTLLSRACVRFIETMSVYRTVYEIFSVKKSSKNGVTLKLGDKGRSIKVTENNVVR